jgi:hypothetical protein
MVTDITTRATDYRLNQLGIRVSENLCQLISKTGDKWVPLGPRWQLPVQVPAQDKDIPYANALSITAYQFCCAYPDSDLIQVLNRVPSAAPREKRREPRCRSISPGVARNRPAPLVPIPHDPIAASKALIRSSRELLDRRRRKELV